MTTQEAAECSGVSEPGKYEPIQGKFLYSQMCVLFREIIVIDFWFPSRQKTPDQQAYTLILSDTGYDICMLERQFTTCLESQACNYYL